MAILAVRKRIRRPSQISWLMFRQRSSSLNPSSKLACKCWARAVTQRKQVQRHQLVTRIQLGIFDVVCHILLEGHCGDGAARSQMGKSSVTCVHAVAQGATKFPKYHTYRRRRDASRNPALVVVTVVSPSRLRLAMKSKVADTCNLTAVQG